MGQDDAITLAGILPKAIALQVGEGTEDIALWLRLAPRLSGNASLWRALKVIHDRHAASGVGQVYARQVWNMLSMKLASRERRERIFAGLARLSCTCNGH